MLAITNGTLFTVTQGVIEKGTILIQDGKITAIGADLPVPAGYEVLDAAGKWVTPGFIDAHTHISTFAEPQPRPNIHDGNETTSPNTAQIRGIDGLNPQDMAIEEARKAGFTTCFTGPGSANVLCGTGIAFKCKPGETVYDLVIPGTEMMKMAFGENPKNVYGSKNVLPKTRMGVAAVLRDTMGLAEIYVYDKQYKDEDGVTKLYSLIYPAADFAEGKSADEMKAFFEGEISKINHKLPTFKQISYVEMRDTEFEKTSSRKIKRHLVK